MELEEWPVLLTILFGSFIPIFFFYAHAFGNERGWTGIVDFLTEDVRGTAIPGGPFLVYFIIIDVLQGVAVFLVYKFMFEQQELGMVSLNSEDKQIVDVIFGVFIANIILMIIWTKCLFTPPHPFYLTCILASMFGVAINSLSTGFSYKIYETPHGFPPERHLSPFLLFLFYTLLGPVLLFFYSVYAFIQTKLTAFELSRRDTKD